MLDRSLNSVLDDIERKNPLKMPSVEIYRFAEPDSPENIIFEGSTIKVRSSLKCLVVDTIMKYFVLVSNNAAQSISVFAALFLQGGTLLKLVERLTYHVYADGMFTRTFLMTYRTFITGQV